MLILRAPGGAPALDAMTDEAGRAIDGVSRITIEIGPKGAKARIERRAGRKGQVETVEAAVTKLAAWFVPDDLEEPARPEGAPKDPAERLAAIEAEIVELNRDDPSHFTEDGKPDANVLSDRLGWRVSARERDEAWRRADGNASVPAAGNEKEG